ncbi:putative 3-ketoacyl-CoA thiolase [Streptomyces misionensis JCM 4497]
MRRRRPVPGRHRGRHGPRPVRALRHPRQQRGRLSLHRPRPCDDRAVAQGPGGQRRGDPALRPGVRPGDAGRRLGTHRQHRLGHHPDAEPRSGVHDQQGHRARADPGARQRTRRQRHHRQRDRARPGGHRRLPGPGADERPEHRGGDRPDDGHADHQAPVGPGRPRQRPRLPGLRRRRLRHRPDPARGRRGDPYRSLTRFDAVADRSPVHPNRWFGELRRPARIRRQCAGARRHVRAAERPGRNPLRSARRRSLVRELGDDRYDLFSGRRPGAGRAGGPARGGPGGPGRQHRGLGPRRGTAAAAPVRRARPRTRRPPGPAGPRPHRAGPLRRRTARPPGGAGPAREDTPDGARRRCLSASTPPG